MSGISPLAVPAHTAIKKLPIKLLTSSISHAIINNELKAEYGRMAQLVGHVDQINQLPAGWEVYQECDLEEMH